MACSSAAVLGSIERVERESKERQQVADIGLLDLKLKASRPYGIRPVEMIIEPASRFSLYRG